MGGGKRVNKNTKRRLREKQRREERQKELEAKEKNGSIVDVKATASSGNGEAASKALVATQNSKATPVVVEYVSADLSEELQQNEAFQALQSVFDHFAKPEELIRSDKKNSSKDDSSKDDKDAGGSSAEGSSTAAVQNADGNTQIKKLSKKQRRLANRLSVAELKQLVKRPDVVEVHDVTAADPRLLVYLKSYRNTVAVPRHWSLKRKYLQGKRGIEKPPFELPDCIKYTGIDKIREAFNEKEGKMSNKGKARANMTGATGKTEIEYQLLYDAFFKFKSSEKNLTSHGDLYYESKEFETKPKEHVPGVLSDALREALGMPQRHGDNGIGAAAAELYAPPYLINMQRYGPPPDYPKLKIAGLNAPIPQGASYGYNPGEWGKPPVDEYGQSRYGNVFAEQESASHNDVDTKSRWGSLISSDEEDSSEEESDSEEDSDDDTDDDLADGIATPDTLTSGISSVTSGMETPSAIDLRKGRTSVSSIPEENEPQTAYTIIPQTKAKIGSGELFGSTHRYVLPNKNGSGSAAAAGGVQVALDPSDVGAGLSQEEMQRRYNEQGGGNNKATLDALTAASKKRKYPRSEPEGAKKKPYKSDFKF